MLDLACAEPREMQKRFSIVMARTINELQGISCLEIEDTPPSKSKLLSHVLLVRKLPNLLTYKKQ